MNPKYFGDSYDLAKRFFCGQLATLGYIVSIDAMLTGIWSGQENDFYRLIGANPTSDKAGARKRKALFLDPDTGIRATDGQAHVSYDRLAGEAAQFDLVFSFDQAFSRQNKPDSVMYEKLAALAARDCHGMYYDSHARFLFVSSTRALIDELHSQLIEVGLPRFRLIVEDIHKAAVLR